MNLSLRAGVLLMTVVTLILPMPGAFSADWPSWQGPNHDGKSPDTGLLKEWPADGPKLLWKNTEMGKGYSIVSIHNDMLFSSGDFGPDLMIIALDSKGQQKWKIPHGKSWTANHPGSRSTPSIDSDKLYIIGGHGLIGCYDTKDGSKVWTREMKEFGGGVPSWGYVESPTILDNMLIVTPGGQTAIVALDKATGKDVWKSDAKAKAHYVCPTIIKEKDSTLIVQGTGDGIFAIDAKTGKVVWSNPFSQNNTANVPTPAYSDGRIYWANGYGKGAISFKVECKDGKWSFTDEWQNKDMVCHHGGYVVDKGYVYGNHNNGWSCIELKSGKTMWKDQKGVGKGSVFFADGLLFLFGEGGGVAGLASASPEGLKMSGTFKVSGAGPAWGHPVVNGGKLYLRYDTNLYCYDVKGK